MSYADLPLLKAAMQIADEGDDSLLQMALDAASALIAGWTGRSFAAETGATKYFYPTSAGVVDLAPDIRTVTSVAVDTVGDLTFATTLASTDYQLWPLNPRPDAGIYSALRVAPLAAHYWTAGRQVRVVGDWGYVVGGVAPMQVQQACLIQAERLFKRAREAPFGILQSTDLGQFTRISAMDPDVLALVAPYKGGTAWVAV